MSIGIQIASTRAAGLKSQFGTMSKPYHAGMAAQTGVEAAALARGRGLRVIENRCPKIEYQRLYGELRRAGFNTGLVSSRLPSVPPRG